MTTITEIRIGTDLTLRDRDAIYCVLSNDKRDSDLLTRFCAAVPMTGNDVYMTHKDWQNIVTALLMFSTGRTTELAKQAVATADYIQRTV